MTGKFGPHTLPVAWSKHQMEVIARTLHESYGAGEPWEEVPTDKKDLIFQAINDLWETLLHLPPERLTRIVAGVVRVTAIFSGEHQEPNPLICSAPAKGIN